MFTLFLSQRNLFYFFVYIVYYMSRWFLYSTSKITRVLKKMKFQATFMSKCCLSKKVIRMFVRTLEETGKKKGRRHPWRHFPVKTLDTPQDSFRSNHFETRQAATSIGLRNLQIWLFQSSIFLIVSSQFIVVFTFSTADNCSVQSNFRNLLIVIYMWSYMKSKVF